MKLAIVTGAVALYVFSASLSLAQQSTQFYRTVDRGRTIKVASFYSIEPDCRSDGRTTVNLLTAPQGGALEVEDGTAYPNFPTTNVRSVCDARRVPATNIYYRANANFTGQDSFNVEQVYPNGYTRQTTFTVYVR